MHLSDDQIAEMNSRARERFRKNLCAFLRDEIPEETSLLDDRELLERISICEQRSEKYGITSDAGIAQFVCLSFLAGPTFDDIPEVQAMLVIQDDDMSVEERLEALVDELSDEQG